MLWYKAWLETRSRFLTCLGTVTLFSSIFLYHAQGLIRPEWKSDFNRLLFVNQQFLVIMWVLSVVLLGMGGLVREQAAGCSSLTLALPVSRTRLVAVRAGMAILQAVFLGLVPWVAVFIIAALGRKPISVSQVTSYVLLLIGGGLVYLALAILVSSLVAGEYTAPALTFGIVLVTAMLADAWLRRFSAWRLIGAEYSIDRSTYLLSTHLPWLGIVASLCVAALMLAASAVAIQRRQF